MALWLTTRIFWIACSAIVSYALPITDENDLGLHLKKIGYLDKTSNLESFAIRAKEAIATAIMDFPKSTSLSETGEEYNETIAMMNMPLYDVKDNTERSIRKKRHRPDPNMCEDAHLDAITRTKSGSVFAFQGDFYWKLHENGAGEIYPRDISVDWNTLEGPLDGAFTLPGGETYFLKAQECWKFVNKAKAAYFPKSIHDAFEGKLRNYMNAAFTWGKDNKTYIFQGNEFWKYDKNLDPPVEEGYPKPICEGPWKLPFDSIDAAIQWDRQKTYFFKGQKYYIYDNFEKKFYPEGHSIGKRWFGCP